MMIARGMLVTGAMRRPSLSAASRPVGFGNTEARSLPVAMALPHPVRSRGATPRHRHQLPRRPPNTAACAAAMDVWVAVAVAVPVAVDEAVIVADAVPVGIPVAVAVGVVPTVCVAVVEAVRVTV